MRDYQLVIKMKKAFLLVLLIYWAMSLKAQNADVCENCPMDEVFITCEKPAEYKGGISKLYEDLNTKLNLSKKINGRVFVQMTISKEGTACCFKYLTINNESKPDFDEKTREAILNTLKELQNWQPAQQRNRSVHFRLSIPIYVVRGKCMGKR
jgi:hypothetical protein